MIIVASHNGAVGIDTGWEILQQGGSALDAVEAAVRQVEDNPDDHTVGYGGYPNLLGEVELDASIMDGTTRRAGAVGGLRGYRQAITLARRVMEDLPHVMLVGEGAAQFAEAVGLSREDLLTPDAARAWREGIEKRFPQAFTYSDQQRREILLRHAVSLTTDPEYVIGTVNVLAQDSAGRIASAVSTSGWAWKYPGRVGDSPVIGAGNYADDRYGAAACTGWGELALQASTAHEVVSALKYGYSLEDACRAAFVDLLTLDVAPAKVRMSMIALDSQGNHCAVTTASRRRGSTYLYRTDGMAAYAQVPRIRIEVEHRGTSDE